jgi:8-oxo-dGTP diphosphatase
MLNRQSSPNMGLWNGVGGKIDIGESPTACVVREIYEETGLDVTEVRFSGIVTWVSGVDKSGMYVFIADVPDKMTYPTPLNTPEGILDWKQFDWVMDTNNNGVVSNIRTFLPKMLNDHDLYEHEFVYEEERIKEYRALSIEYGYRIN